MKSIVEENIIKELDSIYGIEESKLEILDYIKYLEISQENKFANYNVIIHNNSSYPAETKIKLIEFLYQMLKKNNIINSEYEFLNTKQLRKFEKDNDEEKNKEKDKDKQEEAENLNSDLIIIDSEKIGRYLSNNREEIISMMEENKDKVFIIIDESFCVGEVNATFNQYFDWFFEIDKISENNKKDYVINLLNENNIKVTNECNYIEELIEEPFFIVKSKINHIILKCKLHDIEEITDDVAEKYLIEQKDILDNKNNKSKKSKKNSKDNLTFDSLVGINDIKDEINKIV